MAGTKLSTIDHNFVAVVRIIIYISIASLTLEIHMQ